MADQSPHAEDTHKPPPSPEAWKQPRKRRGRRRPRRVKEATMTRPETNSKPPKVVGDWVLKPQVIPDPEEFAEEADLIGEVEKHEGMEATFEDVLSEVWQFEKKLKTAKQMGHLLALKYGLRRDVELEVVGMVEELEKLGLNVEDEWGFLEAALDEVIVSGTIDVAEEAVGRLGDVKEAIVGAPASVDLNLTWAQTGVIAGIGLAITTAIGMMKAKKECEQKVEQVEHKMAG